MRQTVTIGRPRYVDFKETLIDNVQRLLQEDQGKGLNITNLTSEAKGYTTAQVPKNPRTFYVFNELNLISKDKDKFKLFFEITYPEFRLQAIQFALDYDDYNYLSELINDEVLKKDYDYLEELIEYAIEVKDYKFLESIISKDLPISFYENSYRTAHKFNDNQAKDLIWNKINRQTLLRFEVIDQEIHPDLKYRY